MNEQLEDLMYRSGLTASGCWDGLDVYDRQAIEKFALLIVEECATIVERNHYKNIGWNTSRKIKQHFGVDND